MRFAIPLNLVLGGARPKAARLEGQAAAESGARRPWFETRGFAALLTMRFAIPLNLILRAWPKKELSDFSPL